MPRWIVSLLNAALMFVVPLVGWSEYLDFGAKRHWFDYYTVTRGLSSEPQRTWIVAGILLAPALLGLHLATPRWQWSIKGVCAICLAGFLLAMFLWLGFAAVLHGSTRMP
ncbi:hypothetical protein SAMN05192543_11177 [Paraburkholderia megapolitana]|uniref:Uncharacterized protein n=1 Tax=Paraburkholderia megapolitana TaxID=420953 RepID=A0A1I3UDX7_9BURK|nr:hypothetical protein SAMN05192543_11177 [Paraburkholderia megapolitana]